MILKKLYFKPKKFFDVIEFKPGLNVIYAHFDDDTPDVKRSSDSLHAIGKSTFLDLILFALGSDFNEKSLSRLYNAYQKRIISGLYVVLEFSHNNINYIIQRPFYNDRSNILFGFTKGSLKKMTLYQIRKELFNIFFFKEEYKNYFDHNWYQRLLSFYVKVKKRDELFNDPLRFSKNIKEADIIPFHFFLLNIANSLPLQIKEVNQSLSDLNSLINVNEKYLKTKSGSRNINEIIIQRDKLLKKLNAAKKRLLDFELIEDYKSYELEADEITKHIKELWFLNSLDNKRISELNQLSNEASIAAFNDRDYVIKIYEQVNSLLAENVEKEISAAIKFRQSLFSSRKVFIQKEIKNLNGKILKREEAIKKLSDKRKSIFDTLTKLDALGDIKEAFKKIESLQAEISVYDSDLSAINNFKKGLSKEHEKADKLHQSIPKYLSEVQPQIDSFNNTLNEVKKRIIPGSHNISLLDITNSTVNNSLSLSLLEGSIMDSTGINQCRTLIYDISILLNNLDSNANSPSFLIHDGIFEGLNDTHFSAFLKLWEDLLENKQQFQYILTLNDHNFFNDKHELKKKFFNDYVIKELTPNKLLFGEKFE